jgi:hypothetical protein
MAALILELMINQTWQPLEQVKDYQSQNPMSYKALSIQQVLRADILEHRNQDSEAKRVFFDTYQAHKPPINVGAPEKLEGRREAFQVVFPVLGA